MDPIDAGCGGLPQAVAAGHAKVYPKEPKTGPVAGTPVSFFVELLSGIGKTPKDYLPGSTVVIISLGSGILDPDDGKTWDWYDVACPTGPPLHLP
jgi:hypothetical protein